MNTLVSIIVPCYNHAIFLGEALQSVLNQTYTNWECIIVNDGSPDNTAQIAEQWLTKDNRFKYLEKENGGLSSARNAGVKKCKGEFILPLDADDLIHENFLTTLVPVLENNQNLAVASCYSKFFFGSRNNIIHELKPKGANYHALLYENILIATSLYRKQCWEAVGGYDETMKKGFEDWEFWIAITKTGWEFKIVEEFLFYYRKQKQSMLIDTLQNHRLANMEYVYNKHKEIYIDKYETTLKYLFYLINKHSTSEQKIKHSLEFKIAKVLAKPLKWFKK
ncbi:glycosyltransferase family 2 protein [Neotamlana laminarinivorans]|uniref:Glycosyltransferase family 2 protein n=1 Tax=Neotamlana laminarinivorans TaxID=2883124 RepID=A0A9X1I0R6_9FLAO|nr:glycosyltransferase family A protein [Tamlana laminarinivorans]MCB4799699.1 glycosyltransferase family 2 protein [Tamlana laminarinivorans]